jgi:hypothetical protein
LLQNLVSLSESCSMKNKNLSLMHRKSKNRLFPFMSKNCSNIWLVMTSVRMFYCTVEHIVSQCILCHYTFCVITLLVTFSSNLYKYWYMKRILSSFRNTVVFWEHNRWVASQLLSMVICFHLQLSVLV